MIHLLNPFPDLLTYGLFAPILLRIALGFFLIQYGYAKWCANRVLGPDDPLPQIYKLWPPASLLKPIGAIEIIIGICLITGIETQIAAIISAIIFGGAILIHPRLTEPKKQCREFYILLFVISLSLILSGAGLLAIDLPL